MSIVVPAISARGAQHVGAPPTRDRGHRRRVPCRITEADHRVQRSDIIVDRADTAARVHDGKTNRAADPAPSGARLHDRASVKPWRILA